MPLQDCWALPIIFVGSRRPDSSNDQKRILRKKADLLLRGPTCRMGSCSLMYGGANVRVARAALLCQGRRSGQSILVRSDEQFLAIRDAEFVEDTRKVMPDCNAGDAKTVGDVLVG